MYFYETYGLDGALNMALDVALGEIVDDVTLRFYTWKVPTLSLGKHQNADDLDYEYINAQGYDIVRRPSGGRAVLHWDELTYSVVVPKTHELFNTTVLEFYNTISKIIVKGLNNLGYPVEIVEGKKKPLSHVCFQVPSVYEVALDGIKVIGSAQTRTQDYILQHGSIVLISHDEVKHCFKSTKNLEIPLVGLYNYKVIPLADIVNGLKEAFEEYFGEAEKLPYEDQLKIKSNELVGRFLWKK